jgi:hypothetical protein
MAEVQQEFSRLEVTTTLDNSDEKRKRWRIALAVGFTWIATFLVALGK